MLQMSSSGASGDDGVADNGSSARSKAWQHDNTGHVRKAPYERDATDPSASRQPRGGHVPFGLFLCSVLILGSLHVRIP